MARARNIKPGLLKNEILGVADPIYTLLFEGLWMLADREGRLEDRPVRIKGELFPYRDGIDIPAMLGWLECNGFIRRYRVGTLALIQILAFSKHQTPHGTEKDSSLPDENGMLTVHVRGKNGYATGEFKLVNSVLTVKNQGDNTLTPDSGFRIPDSSVPNGTGGKPPEPTPPPLPTPSPTPKPDPDPVKHEIWTTGRAVLRVTGQGDKELGKFLGKLINDYTPGIVLDAVRATAASLPDDPKEYLTACCRRASGKRKTPVKEPEWRTEQRQRTQQAAPGVAVSATPADEFFIDVEAKHVTPPALG